MSKFYKRSHDPVHNYLLDKGFIPKEIASPQDKLKKICRIHGVEDRLSFPKNHAKRILKDLVSSIESGSINKIIIVETILSSIEAGKQHDPGLIAFVRSKGFYSSLRWKNLRMKAFSQYGNRCQACGRCPDADGVVLHVDHILPKSIYPEYGLNIQNLQILCADCNMGKGNTITTKFRRA